MRPVADAERWLTGLAGSHELALRVTLLPDGTEITAGISGSVALDAKASNRGRLDLTLGDDGSLGLIPDSPTSDLAPYGNEIKVERGLTYPDGTTEMVALGVFRLQEIEVEDAGSSLEVKITGIDRSKRIEEAAFETPYQVVAGTNFGAAILSTLQAAGPTLETNFGATSLASPALIAEEGSDRWAFCQGMAEAIGMELYFDGDGVCVLRPVSTAAGDVIADLVEGAGGVLLGPVGRRWTREGSFNRVIYTGENAGEGAIPRGLATDENPLSPTYYFGPYGKVPVFVNSSYVVTDTQAQDAATGKLAKELGTSQSISFGSVVNPALEPGDVVQVTRERAGVDEKHVLDQVTIPLSATESMTGQTRATVSN